MSETNRIEFDLQVEKLVYGGDGLLRKEGQVVFAPRVLPGEHVRVEVTETKPQLLRAIPVVILRHSEKRRAAPCPHFGVCGGCHYQHAEYEYQLEQKVLILRDVLRRVGKVQAPATIRVISGPEFGYRNRAQFHIADGRVGFHQADSNLLCAIPACAICSPKLNEVLAAFQRMATQARFPRFLRTVEIFTNESDVQINVLKTDQPLARRFFEWCAKEFSGLVDGPLRYEVLGTCLRVSPTAFFQVNRFLLDELVRAAVADTQGERAVDLYAGVGLFTVELARRFQKVTAVEIAAASWNDLLENTRGLQAEVIALRTSAEQFLQSVDKPADFVVADPPRSGLGKEVVARLLEWKPRQLALVSCDAATLARDLAPLLSRYEIEALTLVDLFPQTYHIETLARLQLRR
ncbi:MAG: class I SAM-dependent RNA methyltransferase [Bryobacteraceae bacterium]|nr:class I SAM-dependent RNA methyltransferase [Bryobacteraceae bacterium]MDW8379552.1 class I SAM-dependent RNA methyltransferase [Bryobacterales bacterium]